MLNQFGAKASLDDLAKYAQSPSWNEKIFLNQELTKVDINFSNIPKLIYKQFIEKANRKPGRELEISPLAANALNLTQPEMQAVWYGHSALFIRIGGLNILIDPMFGGNSAPVSPIPVRRFSKNTLSLIDNLPEIDLALISHDHYDHLDYESIMRLNKKVKHFDVALGVARHLRKWGIESSRITEYDWWDRGLHGGVEITFTPTRHFSGRGLKDRAKSFWGGWVLKTPQENVYFSGDSGYGQHFKEIGARLGPFDFGFMECGQYNQLWHQIHMYPEESIQAAIDAGVKKAMPVHWAGFVLAQHAWNDPVERFVGEAIKRNMDYSVPYLGQIIQQQSNFTSTWWKHHDLL